MTRGCTVESTNFDGDATLSATVRDVTTPQNVNTITLSGDGVHTEQTLTAETTTAQNVYVDNYGIWDLRFDPGTTNAIDWRFGDWTGWTDNPANSVRNPSSSFRVYLPNGYAPTTGNPNATPPSKPALRIGASVVSGPNPPTVGNTTRMVFTASLRNPSAAALTSPQVTVGIPTGVTFIAGTQSCLLNGTATSCTDGSAAGYRRASVTSLAAGSTLSVRFEVNVVPTAAGLMNITGAPATGSPPPNTTTWAQYTSNWNTTERLGPLCQMVVNVNGTVVLPTPSRVAGMALHEGKLTFATAYQQGTQGFRVFEGETLSSAATARRELTDKVLASNMPDSLGIQVLSTPIRQPLWPFIFIEEIDSLGRRTTVASGAVRELRDPAALLNITRLSDAFNVMNRPQPVITIEETAKQKVRAQALKLLFSKAGHAVISRKALEAAGLPTGVTNITLSSQGTAVPFTWAGAADQLEFDVSPVDTQYTGTNAYILGWNSARAPAMYVGLTQRAAPVQAGHYRVEKNSIYYPRARLGEDPWFWALLRTSGEWPAATDLGAGQFDLPLGTNLAGSIPLSISLLGRSGHRQHVELFLNGQALGAADFDGTEHAVLQTQVAANVLRATGNQLTARLTSTPMTPDDVGMGFVYLDSLDLEGLGAVAPAIVNADSITPYQPSVTSLNGVDYLILSHPDFISAARDFAAMKSSAGFKATVVDINRIYDAYTSGLIEAEGIRQFIADTASLGSLKYVLLWGDDSFDPRNFTGLNTRSFIPSLDSYDREFGRIPSENRYADIDRDNVPDVAIGRIPVQTLAQSQALLNKLGRIGLSFTHPAQVSVADAVGSQDDNFLSRATGVRSLLPRAPVQVIDAAQSMAQSKTSLTRALNSGVGAVHYFGHGSPVAWSSAGSLWDVGDSTAVQNQSGQAVVFSWSCFSEWYQYLYGPSLMESLLLNSNSGVAAAVGPSGITSPEQQALLREPLYQYYFVQKLPLGEAVRRAKGDALRRSSDARDVIEGWNLLGDPSMLNEVGRVLSPPKSLNELIEPKIQKAIRTSAP